MTQPNLLKRRLPKMMLWLLKKQNIKMEKHFNLKNEKKF